MLPPSLSLLCSATCPHLPLTYLHLHNPVIMVYACIAPGACCLTSSKHVPCCCCIDAASKLKLPWLMFFMLLPAPVALKTDYPSTRR
jgi:hypothetical protein